MSSYELKPMKPPLPPRHPEASLSASYRQAEEKARAAVHQERGLDAISIWGLAASAWFTILAIPLLLFPRILLFFAQTPPATAMTNTIDSHYDSLSPLESFLCLSLAIGLFAMALLTLFVVTPSYTPPSPSRWPALAVIVGLTTVTSLVAWNSPIGGLGVLTGLGNTAVAIWGWWVVVFGTSSRLTKAKPKKK